MDLSVSSLSQENLKRMLAQKLTRGINQRENQFPSYQLVCSMYGKTRQDIRMNEDNLYHRVFLSLIHI